MLTKPVVKILKILLNIKKEILKIKAMLI